MLHPQAPKNVPLIKVILFKLRATEPAPLVVTTSVQIKAKVRKKYQRKFKEREGYLRARDMITSTLFAFSSGSTLRAIGEILTVFSVFEEFLVVFLAILFTAFTLMPGHSTFEAHFEATLTN